MNFLHFALILGLVAACNCLMRHCNTVPHVPIDFNDMIRYSPMYVLQTNQPIYPCARLLFTKPTPPKDYTGSGVIIIGGNTFSYDATLVNSTFNAITCSYGTNIEYSIVYNTLPAGGRKAGLCAIECADNGIDYAVLNCASRTEEGFDEIQTWLDTELYGVPGINNAQAGCADPAFCRFFQY